MKYTFDNTTCRNCQTEMPERSLYCPKCSQKNTDGRIPIFDFVKDAFESIFNIDSKFFKTSLGLFIPGKLTNEFFKGKHKSFATPSRLFIGSAILFFAMMSLLVRKNLEGEDISGSFFNTDTNTKTKEEIVAEVEDIKSRLPDEVSPEVKIQLDSVLTRALRDTTLREDSTNFTLWEGSHFRIRNADFDLLSADSIISKYKIEKFADQIIFKQGYKLTKNPRSLITTLIGNLTWMLLLLIPSLALVFKLLYVRRSKFYVEHLVFLFHTHSFVLLMGIILLALQYFEKIKIEGSTVPWILLAISIYTFAALKIVYRQSWIKTLFKAFFIFISYFILLSICISIIGIVSFVLF